MDEEKLNDELTEVTDKSETDEIELDEKSGKMNNFKKKFSGTSKTKKIIALILVIVIVIVAVKACSGKGKNDAMQASTYTMDTAVRTSIVESITGTGTLEPADKYTVTTLLKGDVLSDAFEEGDIVKEDQTLYQIDSSDMETSIEKAQISVSSAQRNYNTAVKALDNLNVKTKVGGTVTDVLVEVGDEVSAGQEIAKVRDDSVMTIELPFPADEADTFYIGQSAEVTLYGSFETLSGTVASVSGATQVMPGNMIVKNVKLNVDNPGAISEE